MASLNFVSGGVAIAGTLSSQAFTIIDEQGQSTLDLTSLQTDVGNLQSSVSSLTTSISTETANRALADSSLQTAIDTKAPIASPTFTGTVSGITKSMVGLGNVDNTSDLDKPISTAVQTALDTKATPAFVEQQVAALVNSAPTTLDTLNELATALNNDPSFSTSITTLIGEKAPIDSPTFTGTVSGITKGMVGLGNVDNTSDLSKPVSTATQAALDLKAPLDSPAFTGTVSGITKGMVGLGNVDNTSDLSKPVSTATQAALDLKAPIESPTFTGTVSGITKSMVGLNSVDNTSDLSKPISTATQSALDQKAPINSPAFTGTVSGITAAMVGLGNVDNTSDLDKPVSAAVQSELDLKAPLASPSFTGVVSGISKSMVGLGNVDNTSDLSKPVSTAQQAALDLKANLASPTFTGTVSGITAAMVGLGNVDNVADADKPISTAVQSALDLKSDITYVDQKVADLVSTAPQTLDTLAELASALGGDENFAATTATLIGTKAPLDSPTFTGTVSGISKGMVGLGNVDNTSDLDKPVSTAVQSELDLKAPLASPTFTGVVSGITKGMVGLANVDNTSDLSKPVSNAVQAELDLKAPLASPTFTGTVSGISKAMVGLGNVDNTSDLSKPVSTAQQAALDLKANLASPTFTGTVSGITKAMVGLGNVDNTSDSAKPVSTAQQTALDGKYDKTGGSVSGAITASGNIASGNPSTIYSALRSTGDVKISDGTNTMTITATSIQVEGPSNNTSLSITPSLSLFDVSGTNVSLKNAYTALSVPALTVNGQSVSGGGGASVAGSDTQVQFNDGGSALGADSTFTFNKTTDTLSVSNVSVSGTITNSALTSALNAKLDSSAIATYATSVALSAGLAGKQDTLTSSSNITVGSINVSGDLNVDSPTIDTDPTNNRVGINKANPAYTLDVGGDVNCTGSFRVNGTPFSGGGTTGLTSVSSPFNAVRIADDHFLEVGEGVFYNKILRITSNITLDVANWYAIYLVNNAGGITITLPTAAQLTGYDGLQFHVACHLNKTISSYTAVTIAAGSGTTLQRTSATLSIPANEGRGQWFMYDEQNTNWIYLTRHFA